MIGLAACDGLRRSASQTQQLEAFCNQSGSMAGV